MKFYINGKEHEAREGITMSALLSDLKIPLDGTAVAADGDIVPKSTFSEFEITPEMRIDIFSLVAGG